ncbi:hypothetical protein CCP3SC15_380022 [Gammaproteobacteria bacterium]
MTEDQAATLKGMTALALLRLREAIDLIRDEWGVSDRDMKMGGGKINDLVQESEKLLALFKMGGKNG